MFYPQQTRWGALAERLKPVLKGAVCRPVGLVQAVRDRRAFQDWRMRPDGRADLLRRRTLGAGDAFTLDFGRHLVGRLSFAIVPVGTQDAPVRLRLTFAESPAEAAEQFDSQRISLSRAWMQDEVVNIDVTPARISLPRRYAFRYVKVEVIATSSSFKISLMDFACREGTSAGRSSPPPHALPADVRRLDAVSLATLRNCMQTVFEDGPKRDRRLWLGDLRLQALVNYETFKNYPLVRRCLYLFAGLARPDGTICSDEYEAPRPHGGQCFILDYTALFTPTLLEYTRASGDRRTARELWPVARRQMEFVLGHLDAQGVFKDPGKLWLFIDWHQKLDRQAAMQGVFVFALRALLELARELGREQEVARLARLLPRMITGARRKLWDPGQSLFISGAGAQVSWASQAWMVIAGIMTPEEGRIAFQKLPRLHGAIRPATPYLWHYIVEAMIACGMEHEAVRLIRAYWGRMIELGATTFWEVFAPADPKLSPYGSHLMNSCCHAWSCTPAFFIRRYPGLFRRR